MGSLMVPREDKKHLPYRNMTASPASGSLRKMRLHSRPVDAVRFHVNLTGSAHCRLGPFWAERLGKSKFFAYQASARGGEVQVQLSGDRVRHGGKAVTVMYG